MKSKPRFFASRVKLARDLGRSGGVVDEHRALLHAVEGAVWAQRDFAQVVVVADAAHDEVLALGRRLRASARCARRDCATHSSALAAVRL